MVFIPSLVYVIFRVPSLTYGLILSILIQVPMNFFVWRSWVSKMKINRVSVFGVLIFNIIIVIYSFLGGSVSFSKLIGSFLIINIIVVYAKYLSHFFDIVGPVNVKTAFSNIFYILILSGFLSLFFKIEGLGYQEYSKSIFTFYEPSHFILVLAPFACINYFSSESKKEKTFIVTMIFIFGLFFPSLIAFALGVMLLILASNIKKLTFLFLIGLIFSFLLSDHIDFSYYTSRLFISEDSNNLSALVYYQGINDAYRSLIDTSGIGLGYQMAGTNTLSPINERIYDLAGMYMNLNDGSFTSSKAIQEFGVLGVVIVMIYVGFLIESLIKIKRSPDAFIFNSAIIASFSIEMFVRSGGYFTLGFILLLAGLFGRKEKNEHRKNYLV